MTEAIFIYKDQQTTADMRTLPQTVYIYDPKNGERDWFVLIPSPTGIPTYKWFMSEPFNGDFEKGSDVNRFEIKYQTRLN